MITRSSEAAPQATSRGRDRAAKYFATATREQIIAEALGFADIIDGLAAYNAKLEERGALLKKALERVANLARRLHSNGTVSHEIGVKASLAIKSGNLGRARDLMKQLTADAWPEIPSPLFTPELLIDVPRVVLEPKEPLT